MRGIIVASGPSAKEFKPPSGAVIFAVNGALDWLERADFWFTLDPSPANQARMAKHRPGVVYHAAVPENVELPTHVHRHQRVASRGPEPADTGSPEWWFWRWSCVPGICKERGRIHTGNSAWGALQLAWKTGVREVLLVGVDASTEPRIEGGNCNNLSHLPMLFESAAHQIKMVNCGAMQSSIERMTIEEGLAWISR